MIITRTVYGAQVQTAKSLGLKHPIKEYTTVNEAINDVVLCPNLPSVLTRGMEYAAAYNYETDTTDLKMQMVCIGNGGHEMTIKGTNSIPTNVAKERYATDAVLKNMIPFVVVPVDSDLSVEKRKRYRLRRTHLINNILYAAYYGRIIDTTVIAPESVIATTVNGITNYSEFEPSISNMRPSDVPKTAALTGVYVSVSAPYSLAFSAEDTQNLLNACTILYGDSDLAMISEIAVCSCVDKPIVQRYPSSGTQNPTTVNGSTIKEAVGTQINLMVSMKPLDIETLNAGTSVALELGVTEPLFGNKT